MTTFAIILSLIAALAALAGAMRSIKWSAAIAWCSLTILLLSPSGAPGWPTILFWGVAAAIAVGINTLLPKQVAQSTTGVTYIAGGALAGTFVGALISPAGMIIGAVVGALCGAVAFSRTPSGKVLQFPSSKFFNYACAKGLPAVVTTCTCGLAVLHIISIIQS